MSSYSTRRMGDVVRAAGMLVYRRSGGKFEYLLLQASYPPYHWTPPKGHVDPGEDEWAAALRETREEAGIAADSLDVHEDFAEVLKYVVKKSDRYGAEVNKQKTVKYWLARLKDGNSIQLSGEHQKIKWAALDEAIVVAQYKEMADLLRKAEDYLAHRK
ncbi:unnamed protein product [Gongylonema pulchrum]|uniref:Bis(5'-nucleosyl)-tetraphosphatase [asymmetrical] n=1 Tax=Gongylonema pulchrum TaxID=637853 RepID=A0A183EF33_9BILA|nr:unnamed protein product [Gongylonema pulchrum]